MTFKTKYPKDEFLNYLSSTEPKSTKEIADLAGCTSNTAKAALFKLEEEGKVRKMLISKKYYVWWKIEPEN
jgi:DNA-binding MarR family transcriptional regulator